MRQILKVLEKDFPDQTSLDDGEMERYTVMSEAAKPKMKVLSEFEGFESAPPLHVPPYFIHDSTFDGMNYHHQIDLNVWRIVQV